MLKEPSSSSASIVMLGSFNPAIFSPDWLVLNDVVGKNEGEAREIAVISQQATQFRVGSKRYDITPDRFQIVFNSAPLIDLLDTVAKIFHDLLPHTVVHQLGINREIHFSVGSEAKRHSIGRMLAPVAPWGEWAEEWKDRLVPHRGGMISLSMQESIPGDPYSRRVTATVQPSAKDNSSIFVAVNDHHVLTSDRTGAGAASLLTDRFDQSMERAEMIINQVMRLGTQ